VGIMEVPCCGGLLGVAKKAREEAERNIPTGIDYIELKDFIHPIDNVIYVTGKDSGSVPLDSLNLEGHYVVTIKTLNDFAMWAIVIAGIVLYDRNSKM